MTRKKRAMIGGTVFAIGLAAGVAFSAVGLMPTLDIELTWPTLEAQEYRPGSVTTSSGEEEIVLVYLGSSSCGWSNLPEVLRAVKDAKILVADRARNAGLRFSALGIATDLDASRGWEHLRKAGLFDEVVSGMGWSNSGTEKYVFGALAGPASTPQLLVIQRRWNNNSPGGRQEVEAERVLVRKAGANAISRWVSQGAVYGARHAEPARGK